MSLSATREQPALDQFVRHAHLFLTREAAEQNYRGSSRTSPNG
jgi:hypothetical protein